MLIYMFLFNFAMMYGIITAVDQRSQSVLQPIFFCFRVVPLTNADLQHIQACQPSSVYFIEVWPRHKRANISDEKRYQMIIIPQDNFQSLKVKAHHKTLTLIITNKIVKTSERFCPFNEMDLCISTIKHKTGRCPLYY